MKENDEIKVEKVSVMNDRFKLGYKIIIPKEEPKQETSFEKTKNFFIKKIDKAIKNSEKEPKTKCYCGHTSYCDCIPLEPKQETLEEAAERFYPPKTSDLICSPKLVRDAFNAGAKWQQEQDKNKD